MQEKHLQNQVAAYLDILKRQGRLYWWHTPNDTYTNYKSVKAKQKRAGTVAGIPDCLILVRGRLLGIELKRPAYNGQPKGWLSKNQIAVHENMATHGADIKVAYSLEQVIDIVNKFIDAH